MFTPVIAEAPGVSSGKGLVRIHVLPPSVERSTETPATIRHRLRAFDELTDSLAANARLAERAMGCGSAAESRACAGAAAGAAGGAASADSAAAGGGIGA